MPKTEGKEDEAFSFDPIKSPHAFIQWKGTDVCMDFYCECGAHCHFDGYFAYKVKCPHCKTIWEMPFHLFPRKTTDDSGCLQMLKEDQDLLETPHD